MAEKIFPYFEEGSNLLSYGFRKWQCWHNGFFLCVTYILWHVAAFETNSSVLVYIDKLSSYLDAKAEAAIRGIIQRCYKYGEYVGFDCFWR